jgi:hypothetical protein
MPLVMLALSLLAAQPERSARIATESGEMRSLSAVVSSPDAVSGTYSLTVEKVGTSGTSRSKQGGGFALEAGAVDTVSTSRINLAPGDTLRATLVVDWADGEQSRDAVDLVGE